MSFDWSEYLYLAQELAGKGERRCSEEALLRAAISRAYYAAFMQAQEFLIKKDGFVVRPEADATEDQGSSHWRVIKVFLQGSNARKLVGEDLRRIRHFRESADYYPEFRGILSEAAEETLIKAEKVIRRLKVLV